MKFYKKTAKVKSDKSYAMNSTIKKNNNKNVMNIFTKEIGLKSNQLKLMADNSHQYQDVVIRAQ